jgi:hypothetical protein
LVEAKTGDIELFESIIEGSHVTTPMNKFTGIYGLSTEGM